MRVLQLLASSLALQFSSDNYSPAASGQLGTSSSDANGSIAYRISGVISDLVITKTAGDRTGMQADVLRNGATDAGGCSVALTSTNGVYEDVTGTNTISAGDTVSIRESAGTGGTANLTLTGTGHLWAADGTTSTHFQSVGPTYNTASQTSFRQPAGGSGAGVVTTQANGEWQVRLPTGVPSVTIKNLYVKPLTNTSTNAATVSVNGATGAGTAPSVSVPGGSTAVVEDTANSVVVNNLDKISIKVVTGASTVNLQIRVSIEVVSDDGISFFISSAGGSTVSIGITAFMTMASLGNTTTTESTAQQTNRMRATLSLLTAYTVAAGTSSKVGLRANGANAGSPAQMTVATTGSNAWTVDAANTFSTVPGDLLNLTGAFGTVAATVSCVAVTVQVLGSLISTDRRRARNTLLRR